MKPKETARILSKGKSIEYSGEWSDKFVYYSNDCFKQDLVVYKGCLLICKKSHLSTPDTIPVLLFENPENEYIATGVQNSDYWELMIPGYSKSFEDIITDLLKLVDPTLTEYVKTLEVRIKQLEDFIQNFDPDIPSSNYLPRINETKILMTSVLDLDAEISANIGDNVNLSLDTIEQVLTDITDHIFSGGESASSRLDTIEQILSTITESEINI